MLIARVIGTTVSTIKEDKIDRAQAAHPAPDGCRRHPNRQALRGRGQVDAGVGDLVLTAARFLRPPDNYHQGHARGCRSSWPVIDSLEVEGKLVFRQVIRTFYHG